MFAYSVHVRDPHGFLPDQKQWHKMHVHLLERQARPPGMKMVKLTSFLKMPVACNMCVSIVGHFHETREHRHPHATSSRLQFPGHIRLLKAVLLFSSSTYGLY